MKLTIFKSVQEAYVADVVEGDWAEIVWKDSWLGNIAFEPWHGLEWDILKR